jgi:hypothetical protein
MSFQEFLKMQTTDTTWKTKWLKLHRMVEAAAQKEKKMGLHHNFNQPVTNFLPNFGTKL